MKNIIFFLLLFGTFPLWGQRAKIDILSKLISKEYIQDSNYVNKLNALSLVYRGLSSDTMVLVAEEASEIALKN